jgi:hypothetical protein
MLGVAAAGTGCVTQLVCWLPRPARGGAQQRLAPRAGGARISGGTRTLGSRLLRSGSLASSKDWSGLWFDRAVPWAGGAWNWKGAALAGLRGAQGTTRGGWGNGGPALAPAPPLRPAPQCSRARCMQMPAAAARRAAPSRPCGGAPRGSPPAAAVRAI